MLNLAKISERLTSKVPRLSYARVPNGTVADRYCWHWQHLVYIADLARRILNRVSNREADPCSFPVGSATGWLGMAQPAAWNLMLCRWLGLFSVGVRIYLPITGRFQAYAQLV